MIRTGLSRLPRDRGLPVRVRRRERIVEDERIDCDFIRLDGYLFVPPGDDLAQLDDELKAAHRAGLADVSRVDRWYNKRWLDYAGLSFEDMKGWGWSKVQHPDHVDRVVARVKRSGETGEPWEDTFPLRGKDWPYRAGRITS